MIWAHGLTLFSLNAKESGLPARKILKLLEFSVVDSQFPTNSAIPSLWLAIPGLTPISFFAVKTNRFETIKYPTHA